MITIVNYGLGNLGSIKNMLRRCDIESKITSDIKDIESAEKIILPGVGHFGRGMKLIRDLNLLEVLNKKALIEKVPILGICLGMQLLTEWSEEADEAGLGWIKAKTIKFRFDDTALKIPHMGWNEVRTVNKNDLIKEKEAQRFYFVHSYYVKVAEEKNSIGKTIHGIEFDSMISNENIYGVQFHPEKSHRFGKNLLMKFSQF